MLSKLALFSDSNFLFNLKTHTCTSFEIYCGRMNLLKSAKISTLKTKKNLKTLKLLPVYNSNIKVDLDLVVILEINRHGTQYLMLSLSA